MKFVFKGFTSLLMFLSFFVMVQSGIILYFTPRGPAPTWINWISFGLRKPAWEAIHVNICLLFLIVSLLHLALNWDKFWCYIKKACGLTRSMKLEALLAVILAGIVIAGTVYRLPPFSMIKGYSDRQGPPGDRGPGFGRGGGPSEGNRPEGGPGEGQGRQFRGGRGGENRDN